MKEGPLSLCAALGASALLAITGAALPAGTASGANSAAALAAYDNCTELNRDFKHGVSDRRMTKRQWICRGATGKGAYKPNLYRAVESTMDRDHDHIACEK